MAEITRLLTIGLLIVLSTALLPSASALADPPPWAGKWKKGDHHHKRHDGDHPRERYRDDGRCREIIDRIRHDRGKIREIAPTGRHKKALQWFRDDLVNAQRDLNNCRRGG